MVLMSKKYWKVFIQLQSDHEHHNFNPYRILPVITGSFAVLFQIEIMSS